MRGILGDIWGNALPPTPDPWLTMTEDGIACDDHVGRGHGYVVLGDGLLLDAVRALVEAHPDPAQAQQLLPASVRERLARDS